MAFLLTFVRRGVSLILNFIKKDRVEKKKSTNQSSSWHTDYIPTSLHQCTHYLLAKSRSLFKKKVTPLIGRRRDSQLLTLIRLIAVPQKEEIEISVESNWPLVVLGERYQFLLRSNISTSSYRADTAIGKSSSLEHIRCESLTHWRRLLKRSRVKQASQVLL